MPVPSTPTFTLTANAASSRIEVAVTNPGTNPDYNEVWAFISGESPSRISGSLAADATYHDYNVASNVQKFYFIRAVNSSGFTDSITQNVSIALTGHLLHVVARNAANNFNSTYGVLSLLLIAPLSRPASREQKVLIHPARTKPVLATSEIVDRLYSGTVIFPGHPNSDLATLNLIFESKKVVCIRDAAGNLLFGVLTDLPTAIERTFKSVPITIGETDYTEHIA